MILTKLQSWPKVLGHSWKGFVSPSLLVEKNVLLEKECIIGKRMYYWKNNVLLENECIIGKRMYWKMNVLLEKECIVGKRMYYWKKNVLLEK